MRHGSTIRRGGLSIRRVSHHSPGRVLRVETQSLPLPVLMTLLRRYLGLESWRAGLTIAKHCAAEADGPAVILIDKEKSFEGV